MKKYKVMFICTGNICRSPLAHALFLKMVGERKIGHLVHVESSGTNAWHVGECADKRMINTARAHELEIEHKSRRLRDSDLMEYDLLLVMDHSNYTDTLRLVSNESDKAKVQMFRDYDPVGAGDVPDPWYGGIDGFEEVWQIVQRTCMVLLDKVLENVTK